MNRRGFFKALAATAVARLVPGLPSGKPLALGVGIAPTPSLSFINDTDTGMYHASTNTIGLCVGSLYASHLARSMTQTKEVLTANLLNRAFEERL